MCGSKMHLRLGGTHSRPNADRIERQIDIGKSAGEMTKLIDK
jgi:hypothetical protein